MNNAKYFPTVQIQVESMLNIPYVSNNPPTILINHLLLPGSTSIIWNEMNMLKLCVWIWCRNMAPCGIHYVSIHHTFHRLLTVDLIATYWLSGNVWINPEIVQHNMFSKYLLTVYYLIAVIYFGVTCEFQWHQMYQIIKTKKLIGIHTLVSHELFYVDTHMEQHKMVLQNFFQEKISNYLFRYSHLFDDPFFFEHHHLHMLIKWK